MLQLSVSKADHKQADPSPFILLRFSIKLGGLVPMKPWERKSGNGNGNNCADGQSQPHIPLVN